MSVEGITSLPFLFCLRWRRGMSMRMRKTAKTGAVTFSGCCEDALSLKQLA
ncbi:hypothetical protein [Desulfosporosinus sp. BICA1-9]|uniref:hypothetical protein n=1 Tax=Desulfosporosinus sp. BICA1-9 TaxID=1531958 RepID=UPI000A6B6B1E|nr:hypothetical protein [Desulfosporosinus sp. BICA1-9]